MVITQNCWLASVDLKYAYYSVPIHPAYQKYFRFQFIRQLYQFTAFPNGLASCSRKFTKLLKPRLAMLRERGHLFSSCIDDIYIQHENYQDCSITVMATPHLFDKHGSVVHLTKSEFIPNQKVLFLAL